MTDWTQFSTNRNPQENHTFISSTRPTVSNAAPPTRDTKHEPFAFSHLLFTIKSVPNTNPSFRFFSLPIHYQICANVVRQRNFVTLFAFHEKLSDY